MVQDGLRRTNMWVGNLYSDGVISGAALYDTNGLLLSNGTGSPTTFGAFAQAGAATLGAGSTVAVTFGTAYTSAPKVVCSYTGQDSSAGVVVASGVGTTGFTAIGDTASVDFDWISLG